MAATKKKKSPAKSASDTTSSKPTFPYSTKPNSLRKFLQQVPNRPKPTKINGDTLKAWDLKDTNDQTIIRVLKALKLVSSNNDPTDLYTVFMTPGKGPSALAVAIKDVWRPLFELSHEPHKEDETTLRNYFNIHSGGSETTIALQMQSFKAVCDFADFSVVGSIQGVSATQTNVQPQVQVHGTGDGAQIHIDLHIHLPENKTRRDYEYMFEDIAKYLMGRPTSGHSDE